MVSFFFTRKGVKTRYNFVSVLVRIFEFLTSDKDQYQRMGADLLHAHNSNRTDNFNMPIDQDIKSV